MSNPKNHYQELYDLLQRRKEEEFLARCDVKCYVHVMLNNETLLHRAVKNGLPNAVTKLLDEGAEQHPSQEYGLPVEVAIRKADYEILKIFLEKGLCPNSKLLITLLKRGDEKMDDEDECLYLWFKHVNNINVNVCDKQNMTPLHYAAFYRKNQHVSELLKRGASLVARNSYGELPLENIPEVILKKHFDECIKISHRSSTQITYDYGTLMPLLQEKQHVLETEAIFYISLLKFKDLLEHPLIMSILHRKCINLNNLFYLKLIYFIACIFLFLNVRNSQSSALLWLVYILLIFYKITIITYTISFMVKIRRISSFLDVVLNSVLVIGWNSLMILRYFNIINASIEMLVMISSAADCLWGLRYTQTVGIYMTSLYIIIFKYIHINLKLRFLPYVIVILVATGHFFRVLKLYQNYIPFQTSLALTEQRTEYGEYGITNKLTYSIFMLSVVILCITMLNRLEIDEVVEIQKATNKNRLAVLAENCYFIENLFVNKTWISDGLKMFGLDKQIFLFCNKPDERYILESDNEKLKSVLTKQIIADSKKILRNRLFIKRSPVS